MRTILASKIVTGLYIAFSVASSQAQELKLADDFSGEDGLITNEFYSYNMGDPSAKKSNQWQMTSGSLFRRNNAGWTGGPDYCEEKGFNSPNAISDNCTNSGVFRMVSTQSFEGKTKVSFAVRQNTDTHDINCEQTGSCWKNAIHIFLRHQSPFNLYYASIQRADNKIVIKRKVPCGPEESNFGDYIDLETEGVNGYQYMPHAWFVGEWKHYSAQIENRAEDGAVVIKLFDDDQDPNKPILTAVDRGGERKVIRSQSDCPKGYSFSSSYSPIVQPGSVGIRGDGADFDFDDFKVMAYPSESNSPLVQITSPKNNETVKGVILLDDAIKEGQSVQKVGIFIDDELKSVMYSPPFTYVVDTMQLTNGSHRLRIKSFDSLGSVSNSRVDISVQN
jgi:hypothetical protein